MTYSPLTNKSHPPTFVQYDTTDHMDIRNTIGHRIKMLRKAKGISQEALANIAEIDRTYMASVENGKRNISIINLEKIINALQLSIAEFFNDEKFGGKTA